MTSFVQVVLVWEGNEIWRVVLPHRCEHSDRRPSAPRCCRCRTPLCQHRLESRMERAAGVVRVSGRPAAVDKVFVAVDEEHGRGTLLWALQNLAKEGAMIVIVHVHCPAQTIRVSKYPSVEVCVIWVDFSWQQI